MHLGILKSYQRDQTPRTYQTPQMEETPPLPGPHKEIDTGKVWLHTYLASDTWYVCQGPRDPRLSWSSMLDTAYSPLYSPTCSLIWTWTWPLSRSGPNLAFSSWMLQPCPQGPGLVSYLISTGLFSSSVWSLLSSATATSRRPIL